MQEILPVIAFIAAYLAAKWSGHSEQAIYWATVVLMISTVLQILVLRLRQKPISKQHWLTASAILVLGSVLIMPDALWRRLNTAWAIFFICMAALNLIVAYNFSDDFWVGFKLWGSAGGTMLFMLVQIYLLRGYLNHDDRQE